MTLFDDLKASLEEAVEIKEGRKEAARETRRECPAVIVAMRTTGQERHDFADRLGVTLDQLKRWEMGEEPPADIHEKITLMIDADA